MNHDIQNYIIKMFAEWTAFSAIRSGYPPPKKRRDVYPLIQTPQYDVLFDIIQGKILCDDFNRWHKANTDAICKKRPDLPVGWATKLINVYLKCRVYVAGQGRENLDNCIHPPIDGGLWQGITERYTSSHPIIALTHIVDKIKDIDTYEKYQEIIKGCRLIADDLNCALIEVEQLWKGTE